MTEATIVTILDRVLLREGGVSNDAHDRGGYTSWGLTADFLETLTGDPWTAQKIGNLSRDQALGFYRQWLARTRLDRLPNDREFADSVIDWAVHSGETRPIRALQKALGVAVDGVLGPQTEAALWRGAMVDLAGLRRQVLAARLRFLGNTIHGDPTQAVFAASWLNRLADQVEVV